MCNYEAGEGYGRGKTEERGRSCCGGGHIRF
jgi:hypothetical protein